MKYRIIDPAAWDRKEYFDHYLQVVPCTYSLTTKLDLTAFRQKGRKLYPAMLHSITQAVNRFENFRTAFRPDGQLVIYDKMNPSYTVFHPDRRTFSILWTEYAEDYDTFFSRYQEDLHLYGAVKGLTPKPGQPENCFDVSMLPWHSFDGFNLNVSSGRHLLPIFTLGRYQEEQGRCWIPIAVQVHHAVCDGYHVCCFLDELQSLLDC